MTRPVRFDHTRTGRLVLAGLWADAALVMAASAWNGGRALEILGDPFWAGFLLGLAVDVGLAVALIGDRALHLAGRVEHWGRALRVTTALMSLGLNCAVAAYLGQWGLVVFHAFLPLLLILLSEYSQSSTLQFRDIADEHAVAEQAERDAVIATERARYEVDQARVTAEREQEADWLAQIRADQIRSAELTKATRERELTDHREERELADRHLAASMASVAILSVAWKRRPRRASQPRPKPAPASRTTPVPVTDALLSQARRVRVERASRGETTGREVLRRELHVPERTARELVRRLGDQPLRVLSGGR